MLSNTARFLRTQLHRGVSVKLTAFVYRTRISEYFDRNVYADTIDIIYTIFVLDSVNLKFLSNSVFYWRETRFLPSREEHTLGALGHGFPKKIYKPKTGEVKTEWWKLLWETSWLKLLVRSFSHDHKKKCDKRGNINTCLKLINSCCHNFASVWYRSDSQPGVRAPPVVRKRTFRGTRKKIE